MPARVASAVLLYIVDNRTCRQEVFGDGPYPPQTFLVVSALARPGMLVEIEVTAAAPN